MNLLNRIRNEAPEFEPLRPITLDALFHEASQLGGVRIWQHQLGDEYRATIAFKRRSGTEIEAKASHSDVTVALARAIDEARELGAGGEA